MSGRFFSFLLAAIFAARCAHPAPLGIMVPAYFDPSSGHWGELNYAASRVPLIAIMDVNNGPGASQSSSYVNALAQVHSSGGKVTGYIYTSYGARPLATVETDIDRYIAWYAVDGFFVDEMANDSSSSNLTYYASLYQYIKGKSANYSVTGNPGANTQESYISRPTVDTAMIFENDSSNYPAFAPSSWVAKYTPDHFAHLPYDAIGKTTLSNYVALAVQRNAGWIYLSDLTVYSKLPTYWTNETLLVQSFNRGTLAPFILTNGQPANQTARAGSSASFRVSAFGSAPLSYQWYAGANPIPGATNSAYTISPIQSTNAGSYSVQITNSAGTAISAAASLTVSNVPTTYNKIIIDGSFDDWTGVPPAYTAAIGPTNAIQYQNIYLANDESNLYLRATLYSPRANAFANAVDNIFIDPDAQASTGYQIAGIDSSLLIQNGNGYQETEGVFNAGTASNLGWQIAKSADNTDFEIAISRNATFSPVGTKVFTNNLITLLFDGDDNNFNSVEDAPPSGGIAYAFAMRPLALAPLSVGYAEGMLTVSWNGPGTLQARASLSATDDWTNVPGAASPYAIQILNSQQYFRLVQ